MNNSTARVAALGLLVLLLGGCGLLWAPLQERSNPLDPNSQDVLVLTPDVDGTVQTTDGLNTTTLSVSDIQYSLIRFNLSRLPTVFSEARLVLECKAGSTTQGVEVYPILQDWLASTVNLTQVNSAGFLGSLVTTATGDVPGSWSWDLTAAIAGMQYGLALKGTATGFASFNSSAGGMTPKPELRIQ